MGYELGSGLLGAFRMAVMVVVMVMMMMVRVPVLCFYTATSEIKKRRRNRLSKHVSAKTICRIIGESDVLPCDIPFSMPLASREVGGC